MTSCLYRGDYGPPEPQFDPLIDGGQLIRGFETHATALAGAQNRGQLEAMKRQLLRGEEIQWCDQGYSWTYQKPVDHFFDIVLVAVILPWFIARAVLPRLRGRRSRAPTTRLP